MKAGRPGAEKIQLHRRSNRLNRNAHKARPGADRRRNAGRPVRRLAARTQSDRLLGVASAASSQNEALTAGVAGLVAGAMSMAAGEYVSVSSQFDTERADLARESGELANDRVFEAEELAQIYVGRGVESGLARQVAQQLMAKDALASHARDELGISEISAARPVQAALTSAATFSVGAAGPLALVLISPHNRLLPFVSIGSLVLLALLGAVGARAGGAGIINPTLRVTFWGALAMGVTAGIGVLIGKAI